LATIGSKAGSQSKSGESGGHSTKPGNVSKNGITNQNRSKKKRWKSQ
jgi:hypothetical protein